MAVITTGHDLESVKYHSLSLYQPEELEELLDYMIHIENIENIKSASVILGPKFSIKEKYFIADLLYSYGNELNRYYSKELQIIGSFNLSSQIEEVLTQLQEYWITISKPSEVSDYLIRYPDLSNFVLYICKIARDEFGIQTQLSLEIYNDPEIEDEYLTLYVRQQHYDENILDKIEDVRKQYEEMLIGRSGWLLVTTDFHPPR